MEKLFFQSSLPRAGSTLLQNILAQNPDIYATPTSGVLELIFGARANYTSSPEFKAQDTTLMKKGWDAFCREGLTGWYNAITDKKYVVDKSRGWGIHYDWLEMLFPEPKIVCMVRDLRDVFASMENNFRKNPDKQSHLVDWAKGQGTTVPKRIDLWAQQPPIGLALERLNEMIRRGWDDKILFVRFEDLCLYPERELGRIYTHLNIPYYTHDFDNIEQVTKEDDTVYGVFGDHVIRTKLEPVPSRAKALLGKDVCDWIWNTYPWFFQKFRYTK